MRKLMYLMVMLFAFTSLFGIYTVGATVAADDNISWTVQGPSWLPEMGTSDKLFDMIRKGKPVMFFFGGRT